MPQVWTYHWKGFIWIVIQIDFFRRLREYPWVLKKVFYGEVLLVVQPLTFYIPFLTEKRPILYIFYWQMLHLLHTQFTTLNTFSLVLMHCFLNTNRSQNRNVFSTFSQPLKACYPPLSLFTFSYTSTSETPTLSYTCSLKKLTL